MRHGGDLRPAVEAYGIAAEDWLDLSTGINPHPFTSGPDCRDSAALTDRRLPDPAQLQSLLAAARSAYNVPADLAVCAAPETEILIRMQPWLMTGDTALLPTTYRSYREAWSAAGRSIQVHAGTGFGTLPPATSIVLVNPNNPDGRVIDRKTLIAGAQSRRAPGRLIVDEAFADAHPGISLVPDLGAADPVIILKSFGKFHGLAGLRLGCAALTDTGWQTEMRLQLADEAEQLDAILTSTGLEVIGGTVLFRLVRHPWAAELQDHLARNGIWVRIFDEAPGLVRIGLPGQPAAMERFRQALGGFPA